MKKRLRTVTALVLALAMLFSLASCSAFNSDEEETTEEETIISKTDRPMGTSAVLNYFNSLINEVKAKRPGVQMDETNKNVSDVDCSGNELLEGAIPTLKNYILQRNGSTTDYGSDLKDAFPVKGEDWSSRLTVTDVKYAICIENEDTYEITILFKDETNPQQLSSSHGKAFNIPDREAILAEFKTKMADYIDVSGIDSLEYTGCKIFCVVNRETDDLVSVEYIKNVRIGTTLTGLGTLESMGSVPCSFTYNYSEKYSFDWIDPATITDAAE